MMRMKAFLFSLPLTLFVLTSCGGSRVMAPPRDTVAPDVVALIGGEPFTLAEFETQYTRTSGDRTQASGDSMGTYVDFLERYVDYRLKVKKALELGLDQDPRIVEEVDNYRRQLARPYLLEREVTEPLLRDLYAKQQLVVDASHILIRLDDNASPADTLDAYHRLSALRDSALAGADFGDLAIRYSEDPSAKGNGLGERGHLGYFSGGRMVKAFEDWAFRTPVGEVSPVFRSPYGYHLVLVHDRKARPDDIRIAHIMIRPGGRTHADTLAALARVDSIRGLLAKGESFADLARALSDDPSSGKSGGDLGFISYDSRLIQNMKDTAFALENINDISEPILTPYGYHLIQLTGRREHRSYEESIEDLKKDIGRLPRVKQAEDAFARRLLKKNGLSVDTALVMSVFASYTPDSLQQALSSLTLPDTVAATTFARLGTLTYTLDDLLGFAKSRRLVRKPTIDAVVLDLMDRFFKDVAVDAEVEHLEARDAQFRQTMEEFKNGLLLFRLMEDSVWTAAAQDSMGLRAYFDAHADAYWFPDRTRLIGLYANSDSVLNAFAAGLDAGRPFEELVAEVHAGGHHSFRYDTTLVAGTTNSVFDKGLDLAPGGHTAAMPYTRGFILLIHAGTEPARPKRFEEARAEVLNEYQKILEAHMLDRLRRRYSVVTYPDRLVNAFKAAPAEANVGSTQ